MITAAEFVELESQRAENMNTLRSTRICTVDQGLYMVLDWFESTDGQPLTCIVQVNSEDLKNAESQIKLPAYLQVARDITDQEEFKPRTLARTDYKMNRDLKQLTSSE